MVKAIKSIHSHLNIQTKLCLVFFSYTIILVVTYGILMLENAHEVADNIQRKQLEKAFAHYLNLHSHEASKRFQPYDNIVFYPIASHAPDWLQAYQQPGLFEDEIQERHILVANNPNSNTLIYGVYDVKELDTYESDYQFYRGIWIAGLIVILVGLLFGWLLGRKLSRPISQLTHNIADNDMSHVPAAILNRQDEIGILSRALQQAFSQVNEHILREKDFTKFASHELRTPVAIIESSAELAAQRIKRLDSQADIKHWNKMLNACREMSTLIDTFLILGRDSSIITNNQPISLNDTLESVIAEHNSLLHHLNVSVITDFKADTPIKHPDYLLKVVLSNLIRNAIYYTEQTVHIHVDHNQLVISNAISKCHSSHNSSGYGLQIVQRICDKCHWALHIQSADNKFRVTIQFTSGE